MQHCLYCLIPDYEIIDDTGDPLQLIETHSQIQNVQTAEHHLEIRELSSGSQIDEGTIPQSLTTVTQDSSVKRKAPRSTRRSEYCYNYLIFCNNIRELRYTQCSLYF